MVKVTFGSTFLVLSALCTFVFAAPAGFETYTIDNVATGNYIYSDGNEQPGDLVFTTRSKSLNTLVSVDLKKAHKSVSAVMGHAGFYVSVNSDVNGQKLIWAEASYPWLFTMPSTIDPTAPYTIKVVDQELYWCDYGNDFQVLSLASSIDSQGATSFTVSGAWGELEP